MDALEAHADSDGLIALGTKALTVRSGVGSTAVRRALACLADRDAIRRESEGIPDRTPATWRVLVGVEELAARHGLRGGVRV